MFNYTIHISVVESQLSTDEQKLLIIEDGICQVDKWRKVVVMKKMYMEKLLLMEKEEPSTGMYLNNNGLLMGMDPDGMH